MIKSFQELFDQTLQDFAPIYDALADLSDLEPADLLRDDDVLSVGTQEYASTLR